MAPQKRFFHLVALILILSLVLVACERPIPGSDAEQVDTAPTVVGGSAGNGDPNVGGGEPGDEIADAPATEADDAAPDTVDETAEEGAAEEGETPRVEEEEEMAAEEETAAADEAAETTETEESTDDAEPETEAEAETDEAAETEAETTTAEDNGDDSTLPETHVVAAGENLYRIGLRYGISWVTLANFNDITNPNRIVVGQTLRIRGATGPTPTPSPQTETTYIVQPGDNLFRIGLAYGISWVQVAEANGLINPNLIEPGMELKIPVDAPGPTPDFTHTVRPGETLFRISLRYGVPWQTIAAENEIESPYVIYAGQALVIPGGS